MSCRGPDIWAIICYFPKPKQSTQDSNQFSNKGCWGHRWRLISLPHKPGPEKLSFWLRCQEGRIQEAQNFLSTQIDLKVAGKSVGKHLKCALHGDSASHTFLSFMTSSSFLYTYMIWDLLQHVGDYTNISFQCFQDCYPMFNIQIFHLSAISTNYQ